MTAATTAVSTRAARAPMGTPMRAALTTVVLATSALCIALPLRAAPDDRAEGAVVGGSADTAWILSKLARPAPMRTGFVELRESRLLKAPLRIAGEYRRPDADTLVREVRSPYVETTTIRAGEATIVRAGHSPRRFSLSRAPELAGLQSSFGALLSGDRKLLEQHYVLASQGNRQQWTLQLTPRDAALAAKVDGIDLYGRGIELRCIETRPEDGTAPQRTLLAGAAREAMQLEAAAYTATVVAALCHGDRAP